jgi:hypothetical protein
MDPELVTGWSALFEAVAARHGAFHLRRCAEHGMRPERVRLRATREGWDKPHPSVFYLPGSVDGWWRTQSGRLEYVGTDAALALRSAAHAQGMLHRAPPLTQVARANGRTRTERARIEVHTYRSLLEDDIEVVNGLRVTTAARTLRDLAHVLRLDPLRAIAIDGFSAGAFEVSALHAQLDTMRAGPPRDRLARVAEDLGRVRTESPFAYEVIDAVAEIGLPVEGEFPWRCPDGRIIHFDGALPAWWVAIECDGQGKYVGGTSFTTDRKRWTQASGRWRTVWVDWRRWQDDRRGVLADVERAVAEADPTAAPAERAPCRCRCCRRWAGVAGRPPR